MLNKRKLPSRHSPWVAWCLIATVVVIAGFPLQQTYLRDRYQGTRRGRPSGCVPVFRPCRQCPNRCSRPAVVFEYPLYGDSLSKYVQFMGVRGPTGPICPSVPARRRQAVIDGRYSYVSITTALVAKKTEVISEAPPEWRWTKGKGTTLILQGATRAGSPFHGYVGYVLYRVDPGFSASSCQGA